MKKLVYLVLFFIYLDVVYSQSDFGGTQHSYVTNQAWALLTHLDKVKEYSAMNAHLNNILDGVYLEDENSIVYHYSGVCPYLHTCTHFWMADGGNNQHWRYVYNVGANYYCDFENSYEEVSKLWNGNFEIRVLKTFQPCGCPDGCAYGPYTIVLNYSGLANAYKNDGIMVSQLIRNNGVGTSVTFTPPIPAYQLFADWNVGKAWSKNLCWQIVGRIIHLIEDNSVPAHVHDDPHPVGISFITDDPDVYENVYLPNHYTEKNWEDANNAGGPVEISSKNNPLLYTMYIMNQITDRFPSNNKPGNRFQRSGTPEDDYNSVLIPFYDEMDAIPISYDAFNASPPVNMMPTIMNKVYVYNIRAVAGFMKYVYEQFNIQSYPPPLIEEPLVQNPGIIYLGDSGIVTCRLNCQQDPNQFTFTWQEINPSSRPPGVFVVPEGNRIHVYNNPSNTENYPKSESDPPWMLKCYVSDHSNPPQTVCSQSFQPVVYNIHYYGCPWIAVVQNDSSINLDNNILHKSQLPQNAGQFITDKYVLNLKPGIFDSKIQLKIIEGNVDSTEYNSVKLYAVYHSAGTKIGITENNEIVEFDSVNVISTRNAMLFDSMFYGRNITNDIQYNRSSKNTVLGDTLNHIYAEYLPQTIGNPGIIAHVQRDILAPVASKQVDAGHYWANTHLGIIEGNFSRRENPSILIMPLNSNFKTDNSVDSIHLAWNKDFKIKYAAIANLSTAYIDILQLPLLKAYHSTEGEVTVFLTENDNSTSYSSSNSYINLTFSNTPVLYKPTSIIDYVLEVNGRIIGGNNGEKAIIHNSHNSKNYSIKNPGLKSNYPNPFNPKTKIGYNIMEQGFVKLKIFDILGREVYSLVNEEKKPGEYLVEFDGSNLSSGIYFYKFETGKFIEIRKMILLK